jgi:hypothetical protein
MARRVAAALREHDIDQSIVGQLDFGSWGDNLEASLMAEIIEAMLQRGHEETAIAILAGRLSAKPNETPEWDYLALNLVLSSKLIRSGQMAGYHWKEVAGRMVPGHAREIAAAVLREQGDRKSGTWFAEHSEASAILLACVEHDPEGTWLALKAHLSSPEVGTFVIGFPHGIIERMPARDIDDWVGEDPEARVPILAHLVDKDLSSDDTLASRLIGSYGNSKRIAEAFFSHYLSGSWWGPASAQWEQLANDLDQVANRTSLPKLRRWALDGARQLRKMAETDRQREEEEDLRRN